MHDIGDEEKKKSKILFKKIGKNMNENERTSSHCYDHNYFLDKNCE
jgi:hypothetical protein